MAEHPSGVIVLLHGSGVDRHDSCNRFVAARLVERGFATVLVDLLDECQARERHNVFDVEMQAARLLAVREWLGSQPATRRLRVGYFATGVGAGVALIAAAKAPRGVGAVVCRGGRPDAALHWLGRLHAATLFIAAAHGTDGDWLRAAHRAVAGSELIRIPGAGDSFREAGAVEAVAEHACRWFGRHLGPLEPRLRELERRLIQREHA